jgi:hypothetical protein
MIFVTIDEDNNIIGYGKQGDIEIDMYPQKDGHPARKSECYWDGSKVVLKSNTQLVKEYKKTKFKELAEYLKENWIKAEKTPGEIQTKVKEKNTDFQTFVQVDNAIEEIKTYIYESTP